jgi:hypothetical protein
MSRFQVSLPLAFIIATAVGCTSASIESSWRSPTAATMTNVVTLSPASDVGLRHSAEDKLAQQLSQHGVRATPGYQVLNDQDLGDQTRLVQALTTRGFDGVVTMRFVEANQKLEYYPAFDTYWGGAWGQAIPETVVRIEVNAYSLPNKQLAWSAMSKSVDPNSAQQVIGDVSKVASARLASQHVVGPAQAATR